MTPGLLSIGWTTANASGCLAALSRSLRRCGLLLSLLASLLAPLTASAAEGLSEHQLKAVLVFNLARFVDWPSEAFATTNSPIVIGILGRDPFGPALDKIVVNERVNGRKVTVERYSTIEETSRCQILFISSSEKTRAKSIVLELKGRPILTVSDIEDFARQAGGMVALYVNQDNKIRLRINLEVAKSEGLTISSKLIQVAELQKTSFFWLSDPLMPHFEVAAIISPRQDGAPPWQQQRAGTLLLAGTPY